jgi:hypothetical protein
MKLYSVVRIGSVALMLAGAFLVGQHYSRTAAAQGVAKWEYKIVGCGGPGCHGQVAEINKLADDGWEVVTLNASNRILLKRAK